MSPLVRRTIHGAIGGVMGAACMTVARMLAQRAGLIKQMVPQAVETWAKHQLPISLPALPTQRALHHMADQAMHLGYGATFGALYGSALGGKRASAERVVAFGLGTWVFGSFVLLPSLKIMRPEWRANSRELAVNVASHLLYAGALALLTDQFEEQSTFQPLHYPLSLAAKTG
jgi:hypothetical protein